MANASDITNFYGNSPGFLTALDISSTYNYTPTVNIALKIIGSFVGGSGAISVNGKPVIKFSSTYSTDEVELYFAKGQTITISTNNEGQAVVTARSIP